MKRVGVFVDVKNLYFCIIKRFSKSSKLNYKEYLDFISFNYDITLKVCYTQYKEPKDAELFEDKLSKLGFTVKNSGKYNSNQIQMTIDIFNSLDEYDSIFLGTSNLACVPILEELERRGKEVFIFSSMIPVKFESLSKTCIEISPAMVGKSV